LINIFIYKILTVKHVNCLNNSQKSTAVYMEDSIQLTVRYLYKNMSYINIK
jgi:hypothetical protein